MDLFDKWHSKNTKSDLGYDGEISKRIKNAIGVAIQSGQQAIVRLLIEFLRKDTVAYEFAGRDLAECSGTWIDQAATTGDFDTVCNILDILDHKFLSASGFRYACQHGHLDLIRRLIEAGRWVINEHDGLVEAARYQCCDIATLLLEFGTNNLGEGDLPMRTAINHGNITMVKFLLSRGAFISADNLYHINYTLGCSRYYNCLRDYKEKKKLIACYFGWTLAGSMWPKDLKLPLLKKLVEDVHDSKKWSHFLGGDREGRDLGGDGCMNAQKLLLGDNNLD